MRLRCWTLVVPSPVECVLIDRCGVILSVVIVQCGIAAFSGACGLGAHCEGPHGCKVNHVYINCIGALNFFDGGLFLVANHPGDQLADFSSGGIVRFSDVPSCLDIFGPG